MCFLIVSDLYLDFFFHVFVNALVNMGFILKAISGSQSVRDAGCPHSNGNLDRYDFSFSFFVLL